DVEHHASPPAGLPLAAADECQPFLVLGVGAVAEVQAEDVRAGVEQGADGGEVGARGGERGDDLGVAKAAHGVLEGVSGWILSRCTSSCASRDGVGMRAVRNS